MDIWAGGRFIFVINGFKLTDTIRSYHLSQEYLLLSCSEKSQSHVEQSSSFSVQVQVIFAFFCEIENCKFLTNDSFFQLPKPKWFCRFVTHNLQKLHYLYDSVIYESQFILSIDFLIVLLLNAKVQIPNMYEL